MKIPEQKMDYYKDCKCGKLWRSIGQMWSDMP